MKESRFVIQWILLLGAILSSQISQADSPFTLFDYFRLKTVTEVSISPDGNYVAFTLNVDRPVEQGKGNDYRELYVKEVSSGQIQPLITGDNYLASISWTPDSKMITFRARVDSTQTYQIIGYNLEDQVYSQLTNFPGGVLQYQWNPAGKGLAFTAREPKNDPDRKLKSMGFDAKVFEENIPGIYLYWQLENRAVKLNQTGTVFDFGWSPDGKWIAAQIAPENLVDHRYMFKDIYLIDPFAGDTRLWLDVPGKLGQMAWSPDNQHLAFIAGSDESDPVDGSLFCLNIGQNVPWAEVTPYTLDFEGSVTHVDWLDDQTMLFSAEEGVEATLHTIQLGGKKITRLTESPGIVFSSFEKKEDMLYLVANAWDHPNELYSLDLRALRFRRETVSNPWLDKRDLAKQEKISYKARDGLKIEGILIYPLHHEKGKKYPLICVIHGGPESAILNGWNTSYSRWGQIAAGQGYFVFMPNYRSSSGRGVEFSKMDQGDLGDEEFLDVIDGIEYLARKGYIDRSRVGIGGSSYGGYFSALGATKYSDHFAAAIPFVGVTNHLSKVNLTDIPYEIYLVHWRIWPNEDPELFYDRSPVKYSSNNKTATLILHGEEDTRVHPSQSLELYRQLKLHGNAPVRLVLYPDEGHGNKYTPSQLDFGLRTMRWYNYYLKGEGKPDELPPVDVNYHLEKFGELELDQGS